MERFFYRNDHFDYGQELEDLVTTPLAMWKAWSNSWINTTSFTFKITFAWQKPLEMENNSFLYALDTHEFLFLPRGPFLERPETFRVR